MKTIFTNKPMFTCLMATAFCFATASAHAATTVLDENFDDGTNATIESLLSSNPTSLPTGTTWFSTSNANAVNLRLGTDTINTYNAGNPYQRFSFAAGTTFFNPNTAANKFLVLGDDSGQLAGSPDKGTFGFAMPFSVAAGTTDVSFSFDWVFKAFGTGDTDRFVAGVAGNGFDISNPMNLGYNLVDQSITSQGALQGPANVTTALSNLGSADSNGYYYLVFGLLENNGSPTTNSAVGIDNINVSAVPLPAAVWTFLAGFMGLLALGRRKQNIA